MLLLLPRQSLLKVSVTFILFLLRTVNWTLQLKLYLKVVLGFRFTSLLAPFSSDAVATSYPKVASIKLANRVGGA